MNHSSETKNDLSEIMIINYDAKFAIDFKKINLEWLRSDFYVEDYDKKILSNPTKYIISKGGHILFAKCKPEIVGTVALITRENNSYELSKMGVLQSYRGLKIGDMLIKTAIDYSKAQGKKTIWLDSNRKLKPALSLYHKFGFKEIPLNSDSPYERADIKMELHL